MNPVFPACDMFCLGRGTALFPRLVGIAEVGSWLCHFRHLIIAPGLSQAVT